MKIAIDRNVPIPAYQQVVDGIAGAIARGDLSTGTRLPSVRNLAVDLGLNVNTVARAYRDLERAGVIDTRPGMGTFVAARTRPEERGDDSPARAGFRPIPATGGPAPAVGNFAPNSGSWRELLAAARTLASAEGVSDEEFLAQAASAARASAETALLAVVAPSPGEVQDILRSLPPELAALAAPCELEALGARSQSPALAAVLTTFPTQSRARLALGDAASRVAVMPVESEYTDATVRALTTLPPSGRIALVTVEKANWDHEANDVMKIIGRSRWLKMVLLENGERGLAERLDQVDIILHVPRARAAMEAFDRSDRTLVELDRALTSRARERILQAVVQGS